jgi:hypothetical protein
MSVVMKGNSTRIYRNYWFNSPTVMKNNMLAEKDEIKTYRMKVMEKGNMQEMWSHINRGQVEKKFGGDAEDLRATDYWPPTCPNDNYFCNPNQKNQHFLSGIEYYEKYNKGGLSKSKVCFDLVEETAIEKIKAAGDAGKISSLGGLGKKNKGNSEMGSDEMRVKDINIDVIGDDNQGTQMSNSENGGTEPQASHQNLIGAPKRARCGGPKLIASNPMKPCVADREEPEFEDNASNYSSVVNLPQGQDDDLMNINIVTDNLDVIIETNENHLTPGHLRTPQNGAGSPFLTPKRASYNYEEIENFGITMLMNYTTIGKGVDKVASGTRVVLEVTKAGDKLEVKNEKSGKVVKTLSFEDFIGVSMKMQVIILYSIDMSASVAGCCSRPTSKARSVTELSFHKITEDHPTQMERFKKLVMRRFWKFQQKVHGSGLTGEEDKNETYYPIHREAWEKKALVILNPNAGDGSAKSTFQSIEKYLDAYGFRMYIYTPKNKGDIASYIYTMASEDFLKFYQVIVFGGNGTVHEVINGYYRREDHDLMALRIGSISVGGVSALTGKSQEEWGLGRAPNLMNSLYVLTRSRLKASTVCKYETTGEKSVIFGFHSFGIGLPVDLIYSCNSVKEKKLQCEMPVI